MLSDCLHAPSCQAIVYQHREDSCVKTCIRFGKSPSEFLELDSIAERWDDIRKKIGSSPAALAAAEDDEVAPIVMDLLLGDDADAMAQAVSALDEVGRETLADYEQEAARLVNGGVKFIDGTASDSQIVGQLKSSVIGQVRGSDDGYVLIVYDVKAAGEAFKNPVFKPAPFRKQHFDKMIRVALVARTETASDDSAPIDEGDFFALFDGGRQGLHSTLQAAFGRTPRSTKMLTVQCTEEALMARRAQLSSRGYSAGRGFMTLNQTESVLMITSLEANRLGKRDNKVFPGTTLGNVFASVGVPDMQNTLETWHLAVEDRYTFVM